MATFKIGTDAKHGPALFQAFLWWLEIEPARRGLFPASFGDLALDCNRRRGCDISYVKEDYGYIFSCKYEASVHTLINVSKKARLPFTKLS